MKYKREYGDFIHDMLGSVNEAEEFVKGMDFGSFIKDSKTRNAVVRSLEVLGEAAKHIPKEIRDKHPAIPWKKVAGLRDIIAHEYFGIDMKIVWKIVKEDIVAIKPFIIKLAGK
jgi:uncharacterized protein with HEPN domain